MNKVKKILIVIDMQNDFISGSLGTKEAQVIIPSMVQYIKNFDGDIYYTQDTHFEYDYANSIEGKHLPVKHCIYNTEGWRIESNIKAVLEQRTAFSITKDSFGSLVLADIANTLDNKNQIYEFYLCGVCTDICVITNTILIKSAAHNSEVYVVENLCAGTTPENHEAALRVMRSCQINILNF